MTEVIVGGVSLMAGAVIGYFLFTNTLTKKKESLIAEAEAKGETIRKDKELKAKERFLELKEKHDIAIKDRTRKIQSAEDRVKSKETKLNKDLEYQKRAQNNTERIQKDLDDQITAVKTKQSELESTRQKAVTLLEDISGLSAEEAKTQLGEQLKDKARAQASEQIQEILDEAKLKANTEAKKIVIQSIQRVATEHAVENSVSVFNIESDDIKGRIIGREGRNIRALEAATGVEFIVDDTPEAIILSCFDPVRREIARLSIHQLVSDGRIHPARIEEVVKKTTKNIEEEIAEIGKRTCIDLGIHGLKNELVRMVGRMKYRSSYGQNLLQHSREVANLCATMAAELGINTKLAKRAGLLHDIGKVSDEESELPHAILGMKLAEKYGENPEVCNAIGAHHDEIEMKYMTAPIVQVCDAISGARPGARREVVGFCSIQRFKRFRRY